MVDFGCLTNPITPVLIQDQNYELSQHFMASIVNKRLPKYFYRNYYIICRFCNDICKMLHLGTSPQEGTFDGAA